MAGCISSSESKIICHTQSLHAWLPEITPQLWCIYGRTKGTKSTFLTGFGHREKEARSLFAAHYRYRSCLSMSLSSESSVSNTTPSIQTSAYSYVLVCNTNFLGFYCTNTYFLVFNLLLFEITEWESCMRQLNTNIFAGTAARQWQCSHTVLHWVKRNMITFVAVLPQVNENSIVGVRLWSTCSSE